RSLPRQIPRPQGRWTPPSRYSDRLHLRLASFFPEALGLAYRLARLTVTYPPFGPGMAPLTAITLSSVSTLTISRFRIVTCCVPMRPAIFMPGKTRDRKLDATMDPAAR